MVIRKSKVACHYFDQHRTGVLMCNAEYLCPSGRSPSMFVILPI
jgi:hypothetical protein